MINSSSVTRLTLKSLLDFVQKNDNKDINIDTMVKHFAEDRSYIVFLLQQLIASKKIHINIKKLHRVCQNNTCNQCPVKCRKITEE